MRQNANSGTILQPFRHAKLCFVGQGRAGKTSTLASLNGKAFQGEVASTVGVVNASVTCELTRAPSQSWKPTTDGLNAAQRAVRSEYKKVVSAQTHTPPTPTDDDAEHVFVTPASAEASQATALGPPDRERPQEAPTRTPPHMTPRGMADAAELRSLPTPGESRRNTFTITRLREG